MGNKTGNQLRKLRKEHGLSQEKFAHEIGVSRQIISRWEKGKVTPNTNSVKKICDYYKINSDLFYNNTNNPAGTEKTNLFSRIRLKTVLKGIAVLLLLLFILYVIYSIYKYMLLKDLEDKFKEYDNWTNYHAEIRTVEEARLIGKTEIWYKDNNYRIKEVSYYENRDDIENEKWIDCGNNKIVEKSNNGHYIIRNKIIDLNDVENGNYINKYLYWTNMVKDENKLKLCLMPSILYEKHYNDDEIYVFNKTTLKLNKNSLLPIIYTEKVNERLIIRYYRIEVDNVSDEDVKIKEDL